MESSVAQEWLGNYEAQEAHFFARVLVGLPAATLRAILRPSGCSAMTSSIVERQGSCSSPRIRFARIQSCLVPMSRRRPSNSKAKRGRRLRRMRREGRRKPDCDAVLGREKHEVGSAKSRTIARQVAANSFTIGGHEPPRQDAHPFTPILKAHFEMFEERCPAEDHHARAFGAQRHEEGCRIDADRAVDRVDAHTRVDEAHTDVLAGEDSTGRQGDG